jgi:hypothetical protein
MPSITCPKCGVELVAGSRFCRRCGQPAPVAARESSSVLEAETRTFAPPTDYASPTVPINSPLTGPAYIAPGQTPMPPAAATKPLEPSGSTAKWALIGLLLILLIVPLSFAVVKMLRSRTSQPQPPVVTEPAIPAPPAPPAPPPPPTLPGGGSSATDTSLIYPGAETTLNVSDRVKGRVLQLRTRDPFDKVVDWYVEKLKPATTTRVPGVNMTVLHGEGINVVITTEDAQTEIIINQGSDQDK